MSAGAPIEPDSGDLFGPGDLLGPGDPPPFAIVNPAGRGSALLIADHAGRAIPRRLGRLGLDEAALNRHIAWDIGIEATTRALSALLDAPAAIAGYSRLVIDCNRPPHVASSIPLISEATTVPGNEGIAREQAAARRAQIFDPYHQRIDAIIDARRHNNMPTILVSLHSFTPVYAGIARPWHIGTLYQRDKVLPTLLLGALRAEPDLVVGDNEPYAVSDQTDYTIPVHAEARGLMNSGIEIRQDLISDQAGERSWADRLARILAEIEATLRKQKVI